MGKTLPGHLAHRRRTWPGMRKSTGCRAHRGPENRRSCAPSLSASFSSSSSRRPPAPCSSASEFPLPLVYLMKSVVQDCSCCVQASFNDCWAALRWRASCGPRLLISRYGMMRKHHIRFPLPCEFRCAGPLLASGTLLASISFVMPIPSIEVWYSLVQCRIGMADPLTLMAIGAVCYTWWKASDPRP
jgi:hypothetical protein